jgi:flagellar biosynthesis protein FliR
MAAGGFVIETFLVFCRVAGCLMLVPGLSSARVPVRVRLYLALVLAVALASLVDSGSDRRDRAGAGLATVILTESMIGAGMGLIARLFIEAIEFAGTTMSNYIGLSGISGSLDGDEPSPTVANLVTVLATLLLLILELPHALIGGLASSFDDIPIGAAFEADMALRQILRILAPAFAVALQISAPFLVYGLVLNIMFAVLGRLVPQISSYFVSIPLIAIGGLMLLYVCVGDIVKVLSSAIRLDIIK